jgi:methylated-DNA-[protein]-cysteine S-methyltransferase
MCSQRVHHTLLLTVVGPLLAAASPRGLLRLDFLGESYAYATRLRTLARHLGQEVELIESGAAFQDLATQLGEYFCGRRQRFDLPLDLRGTPFQMAVWQRLCRIPHGRLRSYRQLAVEIGRPRAVRAVGQAVGQNPVAIVVPCHRVVGARGALVGFGGGIELKAQLLRLEGHTLADTSRLAIPRLF